MKTFALIFAAATAMSTSLLADGHTVNPFTGQTLGGTTVIDGGIQGGCSISAWGVQAVCRTGGKAQAKIASRSQREIGFGEGKGVFGSDNRQTHGVSKNGHDKSSTQNSSFGNFSQFQIGVNGGGERRETQTETQGETFFEGFVITTPLAASKFQFGKW